MLYSWIWSCNILVAEGRRDGAESRGSRAEVRVEEHKHPILYKTFNQDLAAWFFKQKIDSCEIKSLFTF